MAAIYSITERIFHCYLCAIDRDTFVVNSYFELRRLAVAPVLESYININGFTGPYGNVFRSYDKTFVNVA